LDNGAYFYVLAIAQGLNQLGIVNKKQYIKITNGLIRHIARNLIKPNSPSIEAYEGPSSIKDLILPRPSDSIFNKCVASGYFYDRLNGEG